MRSKTSCFDQTIYSKTLRRFWPVWFGGAGIWFLLLPMYFFNWVNKPNNAMNLRHRLVTSMTTESPVVWFLFSLCAAMAVFAWLYNARSVGFTASLPVNRKTLFWSSYLAGFTMLVSTLVFTGALLLGLSLFLGGGAEDMILRWMLVGLLDIVGFYGFACLCAMLTGNLVVMPLCALALEFAAVIVEALVQYLMGAALFGYRAAEGRLSYASPVWALCEETGYHALAGENGIVTDYEFYGTPLVFIYAVLGVLFTLLALRLLQNRRMETAGDTVAIAVLKPVFRWCMAIGCALLLSVIIFDLSDLCDAVVEGGVLALLLFLLVLGGIMGWFGADMIIQKRFRVFTLHTKGAVLLCGILLLFGLSLGFDPLGVEKKLPAREKYDSVMINGAGGAAEFREEESLEQVRKLHESVISHKALHEGKNDQPCRYLFLSYKKDGEEVFTREYYLAATPAEQSDRNSDLRFAERVLNLPEALRERKKMDVPVTENNIYSASLSQWQYMYPDEASRKLAYTTVGVEDIADASERYFGACRDFRSGLLKLRPEEAYELYTTCILPDLEEGSLGRIYLVEDEDYAKNIYNIRIELTVGERDAEGNQRTAFFYTMPTVNSRRTNQWLTEHGVVLETYWEYLVSVGCEETLENGVGTPEAVIESWGY